MARQYIYILTNPDFKYIMIGIGNGKTVAMKKIKELDNAVPNSYEIFGSIIEDEDGKLTLNKIRSQFRPYQVRNARDFFDISPKEALDILNGMVVPGRAEPFSFEKVGIPIGEKVIFDPARIECTVVSAKKIEYNKVKYSLSDFCRKFMPHSKCTESAAYQGPLYFSYKGKKLTQLRAEIESTLKNK